MPSFKPEKSGLGRRGKLAEKEVGQYLEQCSREAHDFDFLRLPDARSAMGRVKAMPADFEVFTPKCHALVEVKQTEHVSRLSRSKVTQLPMMQRRRLAGGRCYLVVYHSTIAQWRRIPIESLAAEVPSWDLSAWPTYDSVAEALKGFTDA